MTGLFRPARVAFAAACIILAAGAMPANAAFFEIVYDDSANGLIDGNIVGRGTVRFDGLVTPGSYSLDTLNNLLIAIRFGAGPTITQNDIDTTLFDGYITVFLRGDGSLGMVFSGDGANSAFGGSVDFQRVPYGLSHEAYAMGVPCCGGTGQVNQYELFENRELLFVGDYTGYEVAEPVSLALLGAGLLGLRLVRRRESPRV